MSEAGMWVGNEMSCEGVTNALSARPSLEAEVGWHREMVGVLAGVDVGVEEWRSVYRRWIGGGITGCWCLGRSSCVSGLVRWTWGRCVGVCRSDDNFDVVVVVVIEVEGCRSP